MKETDLESIPKYQKIALEIAARIVNGTYIEGEKISGRSAIASQYSVSPETARRAFCILADLEIVSAEQGSGTKILSYENAKIFLKQFSNHKNVESIKQDIFQSINRQKKEMLQIDSLLSDLITATEYYRSVNPLAPYTLKITALCHFIGKTIQDIQLWQHTGATLVAIKRNGKLMLSPGPYATLQEHDILYFITQDLSNQKIKKYLFNI